jgi:competence protein ComGF
VAIKPHQKISYEIYEERKKGRKEEKGKIQIILILHSRRLSARKPGLNGFFKI